MTYLYINSNEFDAESAIELMRSKWHYSIYLSAFYVVTIFSLKSFMQNRNPSNLRLPLFLWSGSLAIFSIIGSYKVVSGFIRMWQDKGLHYVTCNSWSFYHPDTKFWIWAFVISKAPELCDTYFIVLRKGKLIFLHWYHHITVLIYTTFTYAYPVGCGVWFIAINYSIHAIMYSYYAIKATGAVRIPKFINVIITALQIIQMIIGTLVNIYIAYVMKVLKQDCHNFDSNIIASFLMYLSYFFLFSIFFYNSYLQKGSSKHVAYSQSKKD